MGPGGHDTTGGGHGHGEPHPVLHRGHRVAQSRVGHPQEQGQPGRDENGELTSEAEIRRWSSQAVTGRAKTRLRTRRGSTRTSDPRRRARNLEEELIPLEEVAQQPQGAADQTDEESDPDREFRVAGPPWRGAGARRPARKKRR